MSTKPKRRTRERILETGLALFNQYGEPNVTTTSIADEVGISPGNLYYHFHNKNEIIDEIFAVFEREIESTLAAPARRQANVDDAWLFLHLLFELVWKYRFLYRDLNDLLTRNRTVETHFRQILAHSMRTATTLCEGMVASGDMRASRAEVRALASNMVVVATYWLSFEFVRDPRHDHAEEALGRGVYQVMSLVAPFLQGPGRTHFETLAQRYLQG